MCFNPLRSIVGLGPTLQLFLSGPLWDWVRHHYSNAKKLVSGRFFSGKSRENHSMAEWERQEPRQVGKKKKGVSHE